MHCRCTDMDSGTDWLRTLGRLLRISPSRALSGAWDGDMDDIDAIDGGDEGDCDGDDGISNSTAPSPLPPPPPTPPADWLWLWLWSSERTANNFPKLAVRLPLPLPVLPAELTRLEVNPALQTNKQRWLHRPPFSRLVRIERESARE